MQPNKEQQKPSSQVVRSMAYRHGKAVGEVTSENISGMLADPETFIWLGLWQPDNDYLRHIQQEFNLHDLAIEDALTAHQRPKIEQYGDTFFIVAHTAQKIRDRIEYGETHLFYGKNFLITVRHGASSSYAQVREHAEQCPEQLARGPGYALYCVLDFIVDNYLSIVGEFSSKFEEIESQMFKTEFNQKAVRQVYHLRRHLLSLRNAAVPMQDICGQLLHHDGLLPKQLRDYMRDVQDHAHQVIMQTDDMREMLTNATHVNLALVSVHQNEVVQRLAGWGAILALPTVVFSLYGMNFKDMPELDTSWGYPLTIGITVVGCLWLYLKLRRAGWL
ncbi:magnesium transporter [Chimaeribacter coloradensis]|uniref:Magnesium transporter n=2 Tax=Chimaeribacter coloradensis TaxID=2060068 RepID=A0A2N5E4Y3_9GAMM|nr:magnesium transporter [Chimaeribacter coloradensis]